jgi:transposase
MGEGSGSTMLTTAPDSVVEAEVTNQNVYGAIRTLFEQGMSKKAIARQLGLHVQSVRKWVTQSWAPQKRVRGRRLDQFREFLHARALEVGFNAVVLTRELRDHGYEGSYAAVVKYIKAWRTEIRADEGPTVRFETGPGEQSQVDWGSLRVWIGDERVKVHLFTMVLGFSRRIFAKAYRNERLDNLLDGHAEAFTHFGGRTESILYDNPRTIVTDKEEATGHVVWNATFKDRMDFYGVRIRLCRYYRAQTKGKIENGVKYVKRNALAGRRFASFDELNEYLLDWCITVADQRVHGTTHEKPADRFARGEKLIAVDDRPPARRESVVVRRVPRDAYVAVETNRYPVPFTWASRDVTVRVLATQIAIHLDGSDPITHDRLEGKHQVARWNGAPRPLPKNCRPEAQQPPRFDPAYVGSLGDVEVRPLSWYQEVAR